MATTQHSEVEDFPRLGAEFSGRHILQLSATIWHKPGLNMAKNVHIVRACREKNTTVSIGGVLNRVSDPASHSASKGRQMSQDQSISHYHIASRSSFSTTVAVSVFVILVAQFAQAQPYDAGDAINPGTIKTSVGQGETDRTDWGVSETVTAWIDGAYDWDKNQQSSSSPIQDTIGDITWTVSGNGSGTAYPIVAPSISIYIDLRESDGEISIDATVDDLFAFANDQAKPAATKVGNAIVPKSASVRKFIDRGAQGISIDPNGDLIYAAALFLLEINPKAQDFSGLPVRENIAAQSFLWNDQTAYEIPAKIKEVQIGAKNLDTAWPPNQRQTFINTSNAYIDNISDGVNSKDRLILAAACVVCHTNLANIPVSCSFPVAVPYQFSTNANDPSAWKTFQDSVHLREYGGDLKGRITLLGQPSNWRGPWSANP